MLIFIDFISFVAVFLGVGFSIYEAVKKYENVQWLRASLMQLTPNKNKIHVKYYSIKVSEKEATDLSFIKGALIQAYGQSFSLKSEGISLILIIVQLIALYNIYQLNVEDIGKVKVLLAICVASWVGLYLSKVYAFICKQKMI